MRLICLLIPLLSNVIVSISAAAQIEFSEGTNFSVDFTATDAQRPILIDVQGILSLVPEGGGTADPLNELNEDLRRPRFGPGGQRIAYQSFADGAWHIGLMTRDGGHRRILTPGRQDDRGPAWSADGKQILFSSDRSGNYDIWAIDLTDYRLTQITSDLADDYAPATSPDGTQIAFLSDRSGKTELYLKTGDAPAERIADAAAGRMHAPRFSPDGARIAYVEAIERLAFPAVARNRLVTLDLDTRQIKSISSDSEDVFGFAPAWRDGQTLLYTADGRIRQRRIDGSYAADVPFRVQLDLTTSDPVPRRMPRFGQNRQAVRGIVNPVVTPDGDRVVFVALGDLWARNRDGALEQLTDDAFVERDPNISDDGEWLAFISDRSGSMQIWLQNLDTGELRQVTTKARGPRYPTFDHSGTRLAYQRVGPRGTQDFTVHIVDIASGATKRLRAAPPIWPGAMSWSADDNHVTVAALTQTSKRFRDGANRLIRLRVEDDKAMPNALPAGQVADFGPVISTDGSHTALIIAGSLWTVPTAPDGHFTGAPRNLLDELVDYPSWAADASHITFVSNRGLETMDVENRRRTMLPVNLHWQPLQQPGLRLVHAGKLFDGVNADYTYDVDITIDGSHIIRVAPHAAHPDNVEVIDASDQTVLPGLIDHHMHRQPHEGEWVGRAWLSFGVTTGVEPGGLPYQSRETLEATSSGRRLGPRLVFAGPQLDGLRKHFHFAAHINSDRRLDWEMQRAQELGYGLIKTYTRMSPDRQRRAVALAHEIGIPVTAHAAARNLAFGGDRVEHLRGTSRLGQSPKQTEALRVYADVIDIIAATGSTITPTLAVAGGFFSFYLQHPEIGTDRRFEALWQQDYRRGLAGFAKLVARNSSLLQYGLGNANAALMSMRDAGVRIVAGTDSPIFPYGLTLIVELNNYVAAGMKTHEALQSATWVAAQAMGADKEIGAVRAGMLADLIIVAGDPLADMTDLFDLTDVLINGRHYPLESLLRAPGGQTSAKAQATMTQVRASPPNNP